MSCVETMARAANPGRITFVEVQGPQSSGSGEWELTVGLDGEPVPGSNLEERRCTEADAANAIAGWLQDNPDHSALREGFRTLEDMLWWCSVGGVTLIAE